MDEISKKLSEMTGKEKTEVLKKLKTEAKEKQTEAEIRSLLEYTATATATPEPEPTPEEKQVDKALGIMYGTPQPTINIQALTREASRKFKPKPIAEIRVAETQDEANARAERWELQRTIKGYFMFGLAIGLPIGFVLGFLIP